MSLGLNDLSGRLLELYKLRRDGSFFDQQRFLHLLQEQEAAAAAARAEELQSRETVARSEEANLNNQYEVARDWRQAQVSIEVKTELDRLERNLANSPFAYTADELHGLVYEATQGGARPVLLVAPFFNEDLNRESNDDGPHAFRVAIRRAWLNSPWASDVSTLDGALTRPLRNTDLDIALVQRALWDLPVLLVYGDVQTGTRVWPSLTAWNIVDTPDFRSIQVNFPPLALPAAVSDDRLRREERLAFEDELGRSTAVTTAMLSDWFHLARDGRPPSIHRTLPGEQALERRAAALGLVAAYEVAIEQGRTPIHEGRIAQADLLRAAGLRDEARTTARSILASLGGPGARLPSLSALQTLRAVLVDVGSAAEAAAALCLAEETARRSTLQSLGW
jgi:hypothetical protein